MANKKINLQIGYIVDSSGLKQLEKDLQKIQAAASMKSNSGGLTQQMKEAGQTAQQLSKIMESVYNKDLGTLNVSKFDKSLKNSGLTMKELQTKLAGIGTIGSRAYNELASSILGTNLQIKKSSKMLDEMAQSFKNTITWGISSSLFNSVGDAIRQAYGYVKKLDTSLTDIRIVTGDSREEMEKFAVSANNAAKKLGSTTLDYTKSALTFYQQGLSDDEVKARTEATLTAANITGAAASQVANDLTAVWNGFKVDTDQTVATIDKLAKVADSSASDLSELAGAMSKVASVGNNMGVNIDQLNAMLATTISVTRQAPETVGNAYKTIFARINDIKTGAADAEISLGNYSGKMAQLGINVLDTSGHLRDTGEVMEQIGGKWKTLTKEQQVYLASTMAGQRQMNNLVALFDNWSQYEDMVTTSINSAGAAQQKQDIYLESTKAHLNELKTTMQDLYSNLIKPEEINWITDALTNLAQVGSNFAGSFGGGIKTLGAFGAMLSSLFSKQITNAIISWDKNRKIMQDKVSVARLQLETAKAGLNGETITDPLKNESTKKSFVAQEELKSQLGDYQKIQKVASVLSETQLNRATNIAKQNAVKKTHIKLLDEEIKKAKQELDLEKVASQDIQDHVNDRQAELSSKKEALGDIKEAKKNFNSKHSLKDQIEKLNLTEEQTKKIQQAYKSQEKQSKAVKATKEALQEIIRARQKEVDETQNVVKAEQELANKIESREKESKESGQLNEDFNQLVDQRSQKIHQTVTAITSSLGTLSMTWGSVTTSMDALFDDSLSAGERFGQIVTNLTFTLPALASSVGKLKQAFGQQLTVSQALSSWYNTRQIAQKAGIKLTKETTREQLVQALATKALEEAEKSENRTTEQQAMLDQFAGKQLNKETSATIAKTLATKQYNMVMKSGQMSTKGFFGALSAGLGVIGIATAALTVLTAVIQGVNDHADKVNQKKAEATQKRYEDTKKAYQASQEEVKQLQELDKTYKSARLGVLNGTSSKEDLKTATDALCKSLGLEWDSLDRLSGKYDDINKKIKEGQKEKLKSALTKNLTSIAATQSQTVSSMNESSKKAGFFNAQGLHIKGEENNFWNRFHTPVGEATLGGGLGSLYNAQVPDNSSAPVYMNVDQSRFSGTDDKVLEGFDKFLSENYHNVYAGGATSVFEKNRGQFNFSKDITDAQIANMVTEYVNQLNQTLTEEQKKNSKSYDYFNNLVGGDAAAYVQENKAKIQQVKSSISSIAASEVSASGFDVNSMSSISDLEEFQKKYIAAFTQTVNDPDIKQQLRQAGIQIDSSEENLKQLAKDYLNSVGGTAADLASAASVKDVKERQIAEKRTRSEYATTGLSTLNSLDESITTGKDLDTQKQTELNNLLSSLLKEYPELSRQVDILNSKELKGSKEYADALGIVKAKLTEISMESKVAIAENAGEKFRESFDAIRNNFSWSEILDTGEEVVYDVDDSKIKKFEEDLDNYLSAQKQIDVAVHTDAEDSFDSLTNNLKKLEEMASKVGDNFIVTTDDIRTLGNTFPGILEGYEVLGDGTIQLNEQVAESAISSAQDAIDSDTEALTTRLDNEAELLRAKQQDYLAMAAAAHVLATSETSDEESKNDALAVLDGAMTDLKNKNAELSAIHTVDMNKAVADASKDNSEVYVSNWVSAMQETTRNAGQWGEYFVKVQEAAAKGEALPQMPALSTNGFVGSAGTTTQISEATQAQTEIDKAKKGDIDKRKWENFEQKFKSAAEQVGKKAQDIESMKIAAVARAQATRAKLSTASSGVGSGGKSSGGGGGSEPKEDTSQEEYRDDLEDERDIYHDINIQISDYDTYLKRVKKQEEKLIGLGLIDNLKKQLDLLEKQKDAYKRKYELQQWDLQNQREILSTLGATFDAYGNISNYMDILGSQQQYVNALTSEYNDLVTDYNESVDPDYKENLKDQLSMLEKRLQAETDSYNNLKDKISDYDKLKDDMQQVEDSIQDAVDQQIEINIKSFKVKIDLEMDMSEAEKNWKEFKEKVLDKTAEQNYRKVAADKLADAFSQNNRSSVYNAEGTGQAQLLAEQVRKATEQVAQMRHGGKSDIYGDNISQALADLEDYNKKLMDSMSDAEDAIDEVRKAYLDMISAAKQAFDAQKDVFDARNSMIDHDLEMTKLLYGEKAYKSLDKWYAKRAKNSKQSVDLLRREKDLWYEQLVVAKQAMDSIEDKQSKEFYNAKEIFDTYKENYLSAVNDLNSAVTESVNNLISQHTNAIEQIVDEFQRKLTDGTNMDFASTQWDAEKDAADDYLDDVQRIIALDKMRQDMAQKMNARFGDSQAQQKISDIYNEQITALEKKNKLSQYDIDLANAKMKIELAQMALEDARDNRSQMRLRRDSQGNYSYQYVADESKVSEAEQGLLSANEEWYELVKKHQQEVADNALKISQDLSDKLKSIQQDTSLTQIEKDEETAYWKEYYTERMMEASQDYADNTKEFYDGVAEYFKDVDETKLLPEFDSVVGKMISRFAEDPDSFTNAVDEAYDRLNNATVEYEDQLQELQDVGLESFNDLTSGIDELYDSTDMLLDSNGQLVDQWHDEIEGIKGVIEQMNKLQDEFLETRGICEDVAAAARAMYMDLNQEQEGNDGSDDSDYSGDSDSGDWGDSEDWYDGPSWGDGDGVLSEGDTATLEGQYYYDSWGTDPIGDKYSGQPGGVKVDWVQNEGAGDYNVHISSADGEYSDLGWVKPEQLSGYATGGYTGKWSGSNGRLALLHPAEYVLNKEDTPNILNAVKIAKGISDSLLGLNDSALSGLTNSISAIGNGMNFEQNVEIHADFPGVAKAEEIKSAFNNLINLASQRATKNRRSN